MQRLSDKVAIITGAGSGIGRAAALMFAREGARIVCADLSGQQDTTAADIDAELGADRAVGVQVDVSNADDIQRMVATAVDRWGRLDVLYNNAGSGGGTRAPLHEVPLEVFDHQIAVHLKGVFLGIKYAVPAMLDTIATHGVGCSIISTASAAGLVGWKDLAPYSAAKGGVVLLTKAAALDYATKGIRVNAVCPGMTWTGMAGKHTGAAPTSAPPQPMARWGQPEELAAAALFLASDESSFITGVAMPVDGGYVAR